MPGSLAHHAGFAGTSAIHRTRRSCPYDNKEKEEEREMKGEGSGREGWEWGSDQEWAQGSGTAVV